MSHEIKAQDLFMKHAPEMQIHVLDSSNASNAYVTYSSVPNRRAGPNKRAGGKILEKE